MRLNVHKHLVFHGLLMKGRLSAASLTCTASAFGGRLLVPWRHRRHSCVLGLASPSSQQPATPQLPLSIFDQKNFGLITEQIRFQLKHEGSLRGQPFRPAL